MRACPQRRAVPQQITAHSVKPEAAKAILSGYLFHKYSFSMIPAVKTMLDSKKFLGVFKDSAAAQGSLLVTCAVSRPC
jgi:hypothetical protein